MAKITQTQYLRAMSRVDALFYRARTPEQKIIWEECNEGVLCLRQGRNDWSRADIETALKLVLAHTKSETPNGMRTMYSEQRRKEGERLPDNEIIIPSHTRRVSEVNVARMKAMSAARVGVYKAEPKCTCGCSPHKSNCPAYFTLRQRASREKKRKERESNV